MDLAGHLEPPRSQRRCPRRRPNRRGDLRARPTRTSPEPSFPQLAAAFLDRLGSDRWTWRNAAPDAFTTSEWVERYHGQTKKYARVAPDGKIPTITRIWGAIDAKGQAAVIVDQRNLRVWAWSDHHCIEQVATDPYQRIADAADIAAATNTSP